MSKERISVKNERVKYLDLLKCLGMFIVVQGHIHPDYGWFSLPLHSFVIPLYFFLSGLTFRRAKYPVFGQFVKHRLKSLMLPYAMFSVVTWVIWAAFNYVLHANVEDYWAPLLQTVLAQGSGYFLVHNVPLWFVPCLFIIECLYYWIDKLGKQSYIFMALLACACVGTWMINGEYSHIFHLLPWSAEGALVGIMFYGAANLLVKNISLKEIETRVLDRKVWAVCAIILVSVVLTFTAYWNGHISIGSDLLGRSALVFYVNAFMGIITITLFSIIVCAADMTSKWGKKIMDFHYWFGRNSFYIMATHVPIKGVLMVVLAKALKVSRGFVQNDVWCVSLVFVVTCILSCFASILVVKMKKHDETMLGKLCSK